MARIRSRDTAPEMALRALLRAAGYRFRVCAAALPGKPDIVLPDRRAVVFMHGCFWHQHPDPLCADARRPRANSGYWHPKLARNVARDREQSAALAAAGWRVFVVWECELRRPLALERALRGFLGPPRPLPPDGEARPLTD